MTSLTGYRLCAKGPFHFGERGVGLEETSIILHADTIFSALCLTLREMGEDLNLLLSRFPRYSSSTGVAVSRVEPPFRFSSAYPFAGNVLLFPRPLRPIRGLTLADTKLSKEIKKIQYVSKNIFEAMLAGSDLREKLITEDQEGNPVLRKDVIAQQGRVWVSPDEVAGLKGYRDPVSAQHKFWAVGVNPRVTVDRATNRSALFAAGQVRFAEDCGLFVLFKYSDDTWKSKIEMALRLLGASGIGGERSVGNGQFDLKIDNDIQVNQPDEAEANALLTLSPYWPPESEMANGVLTQANYTLLNRRGWITSPDAAGLRRQNVRMIGEGSIFSQMPGGALVDVNPIGFDGKPIVTQHDVWRYGLAFPVRCVQEE